MRCLATIVRVEHGTGMTHRQFAIDLIELAGRLGCAVACDVNETGIDMFALPNDDPNAVEASWQAAYRRKFPPPLEPLAKKG